MTVAFQTLNHTARPTLALAVKSLNRFRRAGKTDCRGLEPYAPAAVDERPREHNVFADHRRPPLARLDDLRAKGTKGSLGHESSLIERLLAFGRGDSGEVIPLLQPSHKSRARILQ